MFGIRISLLAALVCFNLCFKTHGVHVAKYPYLYATPTDKDASYPVIEHLAPQDRGELIDPDIMDRPDFLYDPQNQGYRVVEFYIHWCNTCKLYAPIYRKFAAKIRELAATKNIATYAISCGPNRSLCLDQGVKGFPKIRLYKPGTDTFFELIHHTHIQPYMVLKELGIDFETSDSGQADDWDIDTLLGEEAVGNAQGQHTLWQRLEAWIKGQPLQSSMMQPHRRRSREDLKGDVRLSFDYAMRNEIYTNSGNLTTEQQRVLLSWLQLLHKTLPKSWGMSELLHELIDNFVYIVRSEDYLLAVLNEYPADAEDWSLACSNGVANEGYTCGLWEIFHIVTVG